MEGYLKENLRAVRLFLKTLGLTLESDSNLDDYQIKDMTNKIVLKSLNIYNQNNEVIGQAEFYNDKIIFQVRLSKTSFINGECELTKPFALSNDNEIVSFSNVINYQIFDGLNKAIFGNVVIYSFRGTSDYRKVSCAQTVERYKEGILDFRLRSGFDKILELDLGTNKILDLDLYSKDKDGKIKPTKAPEIPDYRTRIVMDFETNMPYITKEELANSEDIELIKQNRETLANYHIIDFLRRRLTIGEIPLFDNLMSLTLDSLSTEDFYRFLGFARKNDLYQAGIENVTNAYFEEKGKQKEIL